MRLRTRIQAPERFEDEEFSSFAGSDATRPAFPNLLSDSTVTFDPHLPPAAFPSLELRPASQLTSDSSNVMNIDRPVSGTSVSILIRTKMDEQQRTAFPASISGMNGVPGPEPAFMDELETSEEEGYGVRIQSVSIEAHSNYDDMFRALSQKTLHPLAPPGPSLGLSSPLLCRSRSSKTSVAANMALVLSAC